uniref:Uncharacterized protein n=1 Tax=Glossina brevipalpis TaxID=37001 RepID=A0A1A9W0P9_9MUSC
MADEPESAPEQPKAEENVGKLEGAVQEGTDETPGEEGTAKTPDDEDKPWVDYDKSLGGEEEGNEDVEKLEEEEVEEDFPLIGQFTDDPEQERNYADYKIVVKELKSQIAHLECIKNQIQILTNKGYKRFCEETDLNDLQTCWDNEMEKQRCLINKVIFLQNFGSKRRYKEIDLTITFDECKIISTPFTFEKKTIEMLKCAKDGSNRKEKKEDI